MRGLRASFERAAVDGCVLESPGKCVWAPPEFRLAHESFVAARVPDHDLIADFEAAKIQFSSHV